MTPGRLGQVALTRRGALAFVTALALAAALVSTGLKCDRISEWNYHSIRMGMTEAEVVEVLGEERYSRQSPDLPVTDLLSAGPQGDEVAELQARIGNKPESGYDITIRAWANEDVTIRVAFCEGYVIRKTMITHRPATFSTKALRLLKARTS